MAKPDKNFRPIADESGVNVIGETLIPPDGTYADTLKLSNADICHIENCAITGGYEDCIDLNRNSVKNDFLGLALTPKGKYGITIKGASSYCLFSDIQFMSHGTLYDIDIGNWSDQDYEQTVGTVLNNVRAVDGKPVRVRVLWGEKPLVIGGNVKVTVYPRLLVKAYRWLRKRKLVP